MFKIVIAVVVQSEFCLEMHQNKIFLIFYISTSKRSENKKNIILSKKKFQNFLAKHSLNCWKCFD
jgi:hypothetical protein